MRTEYVLQYLFNRKWKDLPWTSKSGKEAVRERDARILHYNETYRVVERKTMETVIK